MHGGTPMAKKLWKNFAQRFVRDLFLPQTVLSSKNGDRQTSTKIANREAFAAFNQADDVNPSQIFSEIHQSAEPAATAGGVKS